MSNLGIRFDGPAVEIYSGDDVIERIELKNSEVDAERLLFANLIMQQATIERMSILAEAMAQLVVLLKENSKPADISQVMEQVGGHIEKLLAGTGLKTPPGVRKRLG